MSKQEIVTVPNQLLHEVTDKVTSFDNVLKNQAEVIKNILRQNSDNGIGLSANQLGGKERIFVTEFNDPEKKNIIPLTFFVNPQIVETGDETEILDEGCLSVPNIFLPTERSTKIKVRAQNLAGKFFKLTAKGLFARLIQHETDHLNGILFTDCVKVKLHQDYPDLKKLKMVFVGTGDFADLILEGLILLDFNITAVVTEKPKPSGRGKILLDSPVAKIAQAFGKKLIETENIKTDETMTNIFNNIDLIILADFGQIIPEAILKLPKFGAIIVHQSLLPKYRGPSPIQTAILEGKKETGVSIIKMTPKIDEGPILKQEVVEIWPEDNSQSLKNRLANLGLKMLIKLIPKIQTGDIEEIPQDNSAATFTKKFTKAEGEIDWKKPIADINNQIRAFYPWPGTYTFIDNKRLIIHAAHLVEGKLAIDIVQPEGKQPMLWADFLRGFRGEKPFWMHKISLKK
jgi:methionyl-tRNA formyltransferase